MSKYTHHSLALNDKEEEEFKKTGLGVKKIFMAMVKSLNNINSTPTEETQGDGKNKSSIMLNVEPEDMVGGQPAVEEE